MSIYRRDYWKKIPEITEPVTRSGTQGKHSMPENVLQKIPNSSTPENDSTHEIGHMQTYGNSKVENISTRRNMNCSIDGSTHTNCDTAKMDMISVMIWKNSRVLNFFYYYYIVQIQ